eukprot:g25632.t1
MKIFLNFLFKFYNLPSEELAWSLGRKEAYLLLQELTRLLLFKLKMKKQEDSEGKQIMWENREEFPAISRVEEITPAGAWAQGRRLTVQENVGLGSGQTGGGRRDGCLGSLNTISDCAPRTWSRSWDTKERWRPSALSLGPRTCGSRELRTQVDRAQSLWREMNLSALSSTRLRPLRKSPGLSTPQSN